MQKTSLVFLLSMITSALCLGDTSELWRPFDANKDNALSKAEFGKYLAEQYVALDEDMDGVWTKEEFVKRPDYMKRNDPTRLREKFKRWDKDENGRRIASRRPRSHEARLAGHLAVALPRVPRGVRRDHAADLPADQRHEEGRSRQHDVVLGVDVQIQGRRPEAARAS